MSLSHDTWDSTEAALRLLNRTSILMHQRKPKDGSLGEADWEQEMREFRRFCREVGDRRYAILKETHARK